MPKVDVLLPTCNRLPSLAMTLAGLAGQSLQDFNVFIADQSQEHVMHSPVIKSLIQILESHSSSVQVDYRMPSRGIAEQRDFLLRQASAPMVLYLDDDVWMEPWVLDQMIRILEGQQCGFVGAFPAGLAYRDDHRPAQEAIHYWEGRIEPENLYPETPEWERWHLHRAANLHHVAQTIPQGEIRLYRVAWVASCILYDRQKLEAVGGFSFWSKLPRYQSGEEVLVQNLMMRKWGGCAMVPSGTYYSQMPSTVLNPAGTVDAHALSLLDEMIERYAPETLSQPLRQE